MKARLMHREHDFDRAKPLPSNEESLAQDLGLEILWSAMAGGDTFLFDVAKQVMLAGLGYPEEIAYRQAVLSDCLDEPRAARDLYELAVGALEGERKVYRWFFGRDNPAAMLRHSVEVLEVLLGSLGDLARFANDHQGSFESEAFRRFFAEAIAELDDGYLSTVKEHLGRLRFEDGVLVSAGLGAGNKGTSYTLRRPLGSRKSWRERLLGTFRSANVVEVDPRDESGTQSLEELRARGIAPAAVALTRSMDHVLGFFTALRFELGFYIGCLNLHEQLRRAGSPACLPVPLPLARVGLVARELYDPVLVLRTGGSVVCNDVAGQDVPLVVVTGANQGGKSTFLRSFGIAHLMMRAGMFVPASSFTAGVCSGVFTHFKREEDATMQSGKLDEELQRMSAVVDELAPGGLVLFNESFSATNEREGSEIARQIVRALVEAGMRVVFVTHFFDLAESLRAGYAGKALLLRAERNATGERTFRLVEGDPLPTAYGEDLYRRVFGIPALPG